MQTCFPSHNDWQGFQKSQRPACCNAFFRNVPTFPTKRSAEKTFTSPNALQDAIRERGTLNVNNYSRGIQTEILSSCAFLEALDSDNFERKTYHGLL